MYKCASKKRFPSNVHTKNRSTHGKARSLLICRIFGPILLILLLRMLLSGKPVCNEHSTPINSLTHCNIVLC